MRKKNGRLKFKNRCDNCFLKRSENTSGLLAILCRCYWLSGCWFRLISSVYSYSFPFVWFSWVSIVEMAPAEVGFEDWCFCRISCRFQLKGSSISVSWSLTSLPYVLVMCSLARFQDQSPNKFHFIFLQFFKQMTTLVQKYF